MELTAGSKSLLEGICSMYHNFYHTSHFCVGSPVEQGFFLSLLSFTVDIVHRLVFPHILAHKKY